MILKLQISVLNIALKLKALTNILGSKHNGPRRDSLSPQKIGK